MPTYRYRCESCGDDFEVWQSITDDALTTHDASAGDGSCGGHLVKVLSAAGIVLKGSGFYKTDSRASRSKNGDGTKDASSSDGGSSDSGSKDAGSKDSGSKDSGSKSSDAKGGSSDSKSSDSKSGSSGSGSSGSGSSSKPSKSGSAA
jgi:putative FmdB family regulatory protein